MSDKPLPAAKRLRTRIGAMDPGERNDLVRWITETMGKNRGM